MSYPFKLLIFIIFYCHFCSSRHGEFINKVDRSYDVIKFNVPRKVWNQALDPTPVLRSPVTITLPVHVAEEDENNEVDYIENEETGGSIIENISVASEEPVVAVSTQTVSTPASSDIPQAPILQDEVTDNPNESLNGQVTRFPCNCGGGQCGCCTGTILERLRMKACGNMTFIPEDFVFDVRLTVNNNTVVRRRVSASDPPPICFNPRRAPFVRVCAEISNIRIRNGNAFACLDINADIGSFPIYSASFRCFGLGSAGLQTGLKPKPVSSGPKPINLFGSSSNNDGTILDAAGSLLGGENGIFGAPEGGLFGGGPLDAIGDAVGDIFGGRGQE